MNHFPSPEEVNPRRPLDAYIHFGLGPHACLGRNAAQAALTEMFRAVFKLRNVRRAPGPQGELKKVPRPGRFFVYSKLFRTRSSRLFAAVVLTPRFSERG